MSKPLKSKIMILCGLALYSMVMVSALYWGPTYVSKILVSSEIERNAGLWQIRMLNLLEDYEETFENTLISEGDKTSLTNFVHSSDAYRMRLFDVQGKVFWSTNSKHGAEIAEIVDKKFFKNSLIHGNLVHTLFTRSMEEVDGFDSDHIGESFNHDQLRTVSEIYIPVIHNGKVLGVVEQFRDATDLLKLTKVRVIIAGGSVFAALTLTILIAMFFATNYRRRTLALDRERREQEKGILDRDLHRNREIRLLSQLSEWMQASKSMNELFDMAQTILRRLLPNSAGSIYIYSNSRDVLEGACSWNGLEHKSEIIPDDCWGLRRGRVYTYGLDEIDFACSHQNHKENHVYVCIPIIAHGDTIGLLHLDLGESKDDEAIIEEATKLAQTCAEQLSLAIANVRLRDELRNQSISDPLTGLYNRRHFFETCRNQISAAHRKVESFAIASFDIDHFKLFNDNHGHDAGDIVLRAVGDCLLEEFDGNDIAFRIGGEEFTILLDNVDRDQAFERIEKLRCTIENLTVNYSDKALPRITISAGIAMYPGEGDMPQTLMKAADEALYEAKSAGRNQVILASRKPKENVRVLREVAEEAMTAKSA